MVPDQDRFLELTTSLWKELPAHWEAEILLRASQHQLIRLGGGLTVQNLTKSDLWGALRLLDGQRTVRVEFSRWSKEELQQALQKAKTLLPHMPRQNLLPLTEEPLSLSQPSVPSALSDPEAKAEVVYQILQKGREHSLHMAGRVSTRLQVRAYANSKGVWAYWASPLSQISLTATCPETQGEGRARTFSREWQNLEWEPVLERSIEMAKRRRETAVALEPREYAVLLAPEAVADLVAFLSYLSSSALAYHEGRTYHAGKLGEPFFSSQFTLWEDAYHPLLPSLPFDWEGVKRQKVCLIRQGIPCGLVWDRPTALQYGGTTTGHSLPQPNSLGPMAEHLFMEGGDASEAELLQTLGEGLYISELHYIRVQHPKELAITGMTRGGVFLVEQGKLTKPVRNMRFSLSLKDLFSSLVALGASVPARPPFRGSGVVAPGAVFSRFPFTGVTEW